MKSKACTVAICLIICSVIAFMSVGCDIADREIDLSGVSSASKFKTSVEASDENYKNNLKVYKKMQWAIQKNTVNDQSVTKGLICCDGLDLSEVGCGPIAIYNIGVLKRTFYDLPDIIYWFEQNNGFVMSGALGTNPNAISEFLDTKGNNVTMYTSVPDLESSRRQKGYYIVCQWNDSGNITKGAHYYAVKDDSAYLTTYNGIGGTSTTYSNFKSVLGTDENLIRAYRID